MNYSPLLKVARNRKGMTLIEVMVASGVGMIVMLAMTAMMSHQNKQIAGLRTTASRDNLKSLADRYVTNTAAITTSLDSSKFSFATVLGNQTLGRCLNGNGSAVACPAGSAATFPNCCIAKDGSNNPLYTDFNLVDPADPSSSGKVRFSGTTANPARYDVNGAPCTTASSLCIFELSSQYLPVCPSSAAACQQADSVSTRYSLNLAAGFTSPSGIALQTIVSTTALIGTSGPASTPSAGLLAIRTLTAGPYTPTPGTTFVEVSVLGGGGGGGYMPGSQGGAGGLVIGRLAITGPLSVTVGAAGWGGWNGNMGGASKFGPFTANGGGGGGGGIAGAPGSGSGPVVIPGGGAPGGRDGNANVDGETGSPGTVFVREYGQ